MQNKDVRLNVITLDFANELGQDDSDDDEEENDIDDSGVQKTNQKQVNQNETPT